MIKENRFERHAKKRSQNISEPSVSCFWIVSCTSWLSWYIKHKNNKTLEISSFWWWCCPFRLVRDVQSVDSMSVSQMMILFHHRFIHCSFVLFKNLKISSVDPPRNELKQSKVFLFLHTTFTSTSTSTSTSTTTSTTASTTTFSS